MTTIRLALVLALILVTAGAGAETYRNPVLFGDYSDPDAVRVGDDYYLVSSSFQSVPGLPILHSKDLVHWTIIGHAVDRLPSPDFDRPQPGNGMWAPSLRHHGGWFWIYVGDPDRGIYMTRAKNPRGPWEPLTLVKRTSSSVPRSSSGSSASSTPPRSSEELQYKGWIDPCPLWDDDGAMYLVHAWARSRAGFNSVLHVNRLSPDVRRIVDEGTLVFDGREHHPTIEGPKFYKRNGWYYIFAPAGGVKTGWQTVLRSKNILGPYEDKIILEQGSTTVNGPHQGAWVEAADGSSWFLHFQDRGAYGRIVHLQPMQWVNDWPVIGDDGRPVREGVIPLAARDPLPIQTSDDFNAPKLGLQWQWEGNPTRDAWSLKNGHLRLTTDRPLAQKLPAESFTATTSVDGNGGLIILGQESAAIQIEASGPGRGPSVVAGALTGPRDRTEIPAAKNIQLRVTITPEAIARFSYSTDGKSFANLGKAFIARPGRWIGAKVGLFGRADFDWFRIEPFTPREAASLIVARDGSGDFRTIQEAVNAIPGNNDVNRTILIRNGVYNEKVLLDRSFVSLVGEDREKTRIEFAQLRKEWRASHEDDFGAAVINIGRGVTDINIANLTVVNDYGRKHDGNDDHQFAIRSMEESNRIAILDVNAIADGGDTVSLWNADDGMSYYADSYFEGHVDYLCPRGSAYVTNSRFFGRNMTAGIWHDGSRNEAHKFVIRNSSFDGLPDFPLGRNHRDAQFYLVDARFSRHMADRPIYPSPAPDPRQWGERYYYANAHREGGDYAWHSDNLHTAAGSPRDEDITAQWTFDGRWDPASLPAILSFAAIPRPEHGWKYVDPTGATLRWTPGRNATAQRVHFGTVDPPPFIREQSATSYAVDALEPDRTYYWRIDSVTPTGIIEGKVWSFRADPRTTRIALVGDSTVTEKSGWGLGFKAHVDQRVAVLNLARGGRSTKSYINEGSWADALKRKPTHVLIQFGHNDQPGKGLDRETDMPTFRVNLARYVDEARAIGAKPVLVTSLTRRNFRDSDLAQWADATKEVAAQKNVPLIDLHAKSIDALEELGPPVSPALGPLKTDGTLDKTHLNATGSAFFGAIVAEELPRVMPELASYIRKPAKKTPVAPWSVRMAESEMKRTPDPLMLDANPNPRWEYTPGLVLKAMQHVYERTGDQRYWNYILGYYDKMIAPDGTIGGGYKLEDYNIDRINPGKPLFALYEKTKNEKYRKAIETLRRQMRDHPRVSQGGFWHKKWYPHQMWLDGLYMGAPFLAQYARTFNEPALFDDVVNQYVLMEKVARDEKSGLLYHGWDESRQQKWADPQTGRSPAFWGRAMGWYAMGLIETLDYIPPDHPRRDELVAILQRLAEAVVKIQDPKTGVWWQVLDQGGREGNYLESSVSTMFAFALLKGTRLRYLDPAYEKVARRAYDGILKQFITIDKDGLVDLNQVCQVAGLGGDPEKGERYRSGTYEYYVTEKIRSNDPKGVGPFIFAALEMERR